MRILALNIFLIFAASLHASDSITVYLFLSEDCPICQYYSLKINDLHDSFGGENLGFLGLFPNRSSTERKISEFREKYDLQIPLKREYLQQRSKAFDVKVTPEVVVYNEDREEVVYQGRIDNTYAALGRRRARPTQRELRDVLTSIKQQKPIHTPDTPAVGCFITYME